ncbi:hypothetical protein [Symbiopectobacterium sp. RP]|uniref:hypothetical protein n=1 Tax=Symbiopectobacterium sp. RP TaxID=3248553 RepID=UPI003D2E4863
MITANALICGKKIQLIVIKIMSLGYNESALSSTVSTADCATSFLPTPAGCAS